MPFSCAPHSAAPHMSHQHSYSSHQPASRSSYQQSCWSHQQRLVPPAQPLVPSSARLIISQSSHQQPPQPHQAPLVPSAQLIFPAAHSRSTHQRNRCGAAWSHISRPAACPISTAPRPSSSSSNQQPLVPSAAARPISSHRSHVNSAGSYNDDLQSTVQVCGFEGSFCCQLLQSYSITEIFVNKNSRRRVCK